MKYVLVGQMPVKIRPVHSHRIESYSMKWGSKRCVVDNQIICSYYLFIYLYIHMDNSSVDFLILVRYRMHMLCTYRYFCAHTFWFFISLYLFWNKNNNALNEHMFWTTAATITITEHNWITELFYIVFLKCRKVGGEQLKEKKRL